MFTGEGAPQVNTETEAGVSESYVWVLIRTGCLAGALASVWTDQLRFPWASFSSIHNIVLVPDPGIGKHILYSESCVCKISSASPFLEPVGGPRNSEAKFSYLDQVLTLHLL